METKHQKTIAAHLNFLRELKLALSYSDKISIKKLITKHGISNLVYKPLKEGGILEVKGSGKATNIKWICKIEPNIKMAEELCKRTKSMQDTANKKRGKGKAKSNTQTKSHTRKSYLWGVYTFEKTVQS